MSFHFNNAIFETSVGLNNQIFESDLPEFVFTGKSNVGKSSIINAIFNRKSLARVSSMPGKTVTINFYRLDNIRFVDLPGYGYAKVSKEKQCNWNDVINNYFLSNRDIVLIFVLIDIRNKPNVDDINLINFLIENELPFVVVLTKIDKLNKTQFDLRINQIKNELPDGDLLEYVYTSSEKNIGIDEIRNIIENSI